MADTKTSKEQNRKTGIDILGDVPWGTHFCLFYQNKQDLIDILVPYFKAGLENNEFCMWVTSEPLNVEDARKSLKQVVPNLDDYIKKSKIEILDYNDWYTKSESFEADEVLKGWVKKHDKAVKRGFDGLRLTGNTSWLKKRDWKNFLDYEETVNNVIGKYWMLAVCTYSLDKCKASEIIDVVNAHQITIIKKQDRWQPIENSERKQAQQKIQEARQYADKIIETVREPFLVLDKNLKVVSANDYFYEAFNVKPEETDGQFIYNLGNRQWDIPKLRELLHEILPKKNSFENFEVKHDFPNIGPKRMLLNASQVDEVQLILLAIEDITELKKVEEESRQARDYTENIFNYSNAPIIFWDKDLKILRFNHAFEHLTGYAAEEIIGQELAVLFPKVSEGECLVKIARTLKGEYWKSVEIPILCKDGSIRLALWNSANIYSKDGKTLIATIAQGIDITERKKAEKEIRTLNQQMEFILGVTKTGIDIIDSEFNIRYINNEWKKVYGEPAGRKCYEYFMDRNEVCPGCGIVKALETKSITVSEEVLVKESNRPIQVTTMPFQDENGEWLVAEVNTDIIERKQVEAELRTLNKELKATIKKLTLANRELQDFARAASHDLKAPLVGIKKLTEWISTDYADKLDDGGRDLINSLLTRVDRMYNLIGGILKYSKIGSVREEQSLVNLNELVPEVIDMLAPPANITITVENPLPVVECENTHITEVFLNLLSNAIKFMDKPQGEVKIGCVEENGFWKFSIADNGPGIEERHFERVFELFKTLQPRDKFESTGVGLAVVKKIVKLYKGRIWVESVPGKGCAFFFTLPKQKVEVASAKLEANIAR